MGWQRPATPGFIVTLVATILLAVVSFSVPYLKSVFFLRASIKQGDVSGSIIFGTLGYCVELSNGTVCSKPKVGYELDINSLVGNSLPIQIPQVVVKWLTTALVLHIAALIAAAAAAAFGLLAHAREASMACCSTFISGFAAVIALIAFVIDLIIFFVAKARINAVGSAQIGSGIWLTFAAWILLFFSGCFYSFGRSCISNRPSKGYGDNNNNRRTSEDYTSNQRRLDAVKAEADRKARQKQNLHEIGLPAFPEVEREPLTASIRGDQVDVTRPQTGYVQREPGTRAVDGYYQSTYPPQRAHSSSASSAYAPSAYASNALPPPTVPQFPTRQYTLPTERPYGYTSPSPVQMPVPMPVQTPNQPSYSNYPQYNHYDDNPYGEIRSSPSPYEPPRSQSLLDPPSVPYAPTPTPTPPNQSAKLEHILYPPNQSPSNPYIVPSPTSFQNHQPTYSSYPLDYGAQTQRPVDLPPHYQS